MTRRPAWAANPSRERTFTSNLSSACWCTVQSFILFVSVSVESVHRFAAHWVSFTFTVGKEPVDWEIYRGDSLQLITTPEDALSIALKLKSAIMQHMGGTLLSFGFAIVTAKAYLFIRSTI